MTTEFTPNHYNADAICECDNCGHKCRAGNLNPIKDPGQRLCTGDALPAGECIQCGSLSYAPARKPEQPPGDDLSECLRAELDAMRKEYWGPDHWKALAADAEPLDNGLADIDDYEKRVRSLEAEGMTRSDAQAVADAEPRPEYTLELIHNGIQNSDTVAYTFDSEPELRAFHRGLRVAAKLKAWEVVYTDEEDINDDNR